MGKRIRAQRRGSSPKNRVRSHRFPAANRLPRKDGDVGEVVEMIHSPVHTGPLAKLKFDDGTTGHFAATEGMYVGQKVAFGENEGNREIAPRAYKTVWYYYYFHPRAGNQLFMWKYVF